jgi:hypothetical protein
MKSAFAAGTVVVFATTTAMGDTSSTATQSKTTTSTKWRSPRATRGGSSSTTLTNTQSKGVTIGTSSPQRQHNSGWSASQRPSQPHPYAGGWHLAVGKSRPCLLTLYAGFNADGGGTTTTGCPSADLQAVGNWILQAGHTLTPTKGLVSTVATLTRIAPGRFQGTTKSGQPITVWP